MYGYGYSANIKKTLSSGGSSGFDSDAQLLFDTYPSIPNRAKPYYNNLIVAFKASGAWDESGFRCLVIYPSQNHEERFMEIKTRTLVPEIYNGNSPYVSPFDTANIRASSKGFIMNLSGRHIRTGFIANDLQSYSSNFRMLCTYNSYALDNDFLSGAFEASGARSSLFAVIGSELWMDSSSSSATGRHKQSIASVEAGIYTFNRRSDSDAEVRINGTVVKSVTTNDGALPEIEDYVNSYNNGGVTSSTAGNTPATMYVVGGAGLSNAAMTTLETEVDNFLNGLNLLEDAYNKNFIVDGNSHTTMYWAAIVKGLEQSYGFGLDYRFNNFGVSGQTTAQMITDAGTQIDPLYDNLLSENLLLAFEMTNDYNATGSAATTISNYETYCDDRTAVGWTVVACGLMARGLMSEAVAQDYQTINQTVIDNFVGDGRAAVVVTPPEEVFVFQEVGESNADYATRLSNLTLNTTWFQSDRVHLTPAGYKLWSDKITTAINTIL